jgi:hypothetical protein
MSSSEWPRSLLRGLKGSGDASPSWDMASAGLRSGKYPRRWTALNRDATHRLNPRRSATVSVNFDPQ